MSLFTSFGFAMGLYLAAQERQLRWNAARKVGWNAAHAEPR